MSEGLGDVGSFRFTCGCRVTQPDYGEIAALAGYDFDGKRVRLLGFGRYAGDDIPPQHVTGEWADAARQRGVMLPFYLLESGDIVWAEECHITEAARARSRLTNLALTGYSIERVTLAWLRGMPQAPPPKDESGIYRRMHE